MTERRGWSVMAMPEFCQIDARSSVTERCDSASTINRTRMRRGVVMLHATPIVFVVDDDASVRKSLELLIDAAGWRPETFASAQEFLRRPRVVAPSCLILDVSLPDLDGLELQKRVAPDRTEMPIIFISGYGDVPKTVRAMKAGADAFLTKPFNAGDLLSAIREAIRWSQQAHNRQSDMRQLQQRCEKLTPREHEVMDLAAPALLNKQVG